MFIANKLKMRGRGPYIILPMMTTLFCGCVGMCMLGQYVVTHTVMHILTREGAVRGASDCIRVAVNPPSWFHCCTYQV